MIKDYADDTLYFLSVTKISGKRPNLILLTSISCVSVLSLIPVDHINPQLEIVSDKCMIYYFFLLKISKLPSPFLNSH